MQAKTTDVLELLRELIERESVTPNDAGCQELLGQILGPLGFKLESMRFGETDNLWARRGDSGPVLCFAGHTDVVPPGDMKAWTYPPFEPTEHEGLLYGRGAADMKASLAAMVVAAERFVHRHGEHTGSLAFLITSDEEGRARDGTLKVINALQARDETIDWCLVGEPSSQETLGDLIRIGRRGSLSGMLRVIGVQGHVAYPQLADNPITAFAPALAELNQTVWDEGNEWFPPTSFQCVQIQAGAGAPNVIPGELNTRFNFRYCTEWHHDQLKEKVTQILDSHGLNYELNWHLSGEPFLTGKRTLIDATVNAIKAQTGEEPELSTGGGTSDGRFISPAGVEVVELGPINASIHKVDEHIRITDLEPLCAMYLSVMEGLLLKDHPARA